MRSLPKDIQDQIKADFGNLESEALELLKKAFWQDDYLDHPRISRCVVFLAKGTIAGLKTSLELAQADKRDVI